MNTVQTWQSRTGPREKYRYVVVLQFTVDAVCTYTRKNAPYLRLLWQRRPSAVGFVLSLTHFTSCCQISNMSICKTKWTQQRSPTKALKLFSWLPYMTETHTHFRRMLKKVSTLYYHLLRKMVSYSVNSKQCETHRIRLVTPLRPFDF